MGLEDLFACDVVGYRQGSAAFGTTAGDNLAAVFGGHSLTESMLVDPATVGGLECSFHLLGDI